MEYKIPVRVDGFITREHFVVGSKLGTGYSVKILSMDENFEKWFLCKEEPPFKGSTVTNFIVHPTEELSDVVIAKKLGGKHTTTLYEIFSLMQMQTSNIGGWEYPLVMGGYHGWGSQFFVEGVAGVVRTVRIVYNPPFDHGEKYRERAGWEIYASHFNSRINSRSWIFYRTSKWQKLRQSAWSKTTTILEKVTDKLREKTLKNR